MEDQTSGTGPDEVERRDYAALVDSLAGTLDLRGGLAEAVDVAGYTAMSSRIASHLNLEAGLQSALAAHRGTGQSLELGATTNPSDLLLRAGAGDSAAWDEIVRRYRNVVFASVRSFRLQDADALDAVQMTWLRLAENCHRIQWPERLGGWLATTARRECLHILLHQAQHPSPTPHAAAEAAVTEDDSSAERRIIEADTTRTLRKLVAELSPLRRALVSDNPQPYAAAARAGIPLGGIGPTRARALLQLRQRFAGRVPETSVSDIPIDAPPSSPQRPDRRQAPRRFAAPGIVFAVRYEDDEETETFLIGAREEGVHGDLEVYSPSSLLGKAIIGAHEGKDLLGYELFNGGSMTLALV